MRSWIIAALLLAGCATQEPAAAPASRAPAASAPTYTDARSTASDAEIRDARRAYRSACQSSGSADYCECMTAGMAQILPPADLNVATAALTGASVSASSAARARVEAARAQVDAGCAHYRRD
jgi:hypothetical protein